VGGLVGGGGFKKVYDPSSPHLVCVCVCVCLCVSVCLFEMAHDLCSPNRVRIYVCKRERVCVYVFVCSCLCVCVCVRGWVICG